MYNTLFITAKVETTKANTKVTIEKSATLSSENLSFSAIGEFTKQFTKLTALLKRTAKDDQAYITLTVMNYAMEASTSKITRYNEWKCNGYISDVTAELDNGLKGYYLQPGQNTPEHHDMVFDYTLESITDNYIFSHGYNQ